MKTRGAFHGTIGAVAVGAGSVSIFFQMFFWFQAQTVIGSEGSQVVGFFFLELVSILLILLGSYSLYRSIESSGRRGDGGWSVVEVFRMVMNSRRDIRIGVAAGIIYALSYALVSSMIVYQPSVDFAATYGVTSPSWSTVSCCGSYGTIPMIVAYLAPQLHIGFQLIPLDLLLLAFVPVLVAINSAVASFAFSNRPRGPTRMWLAGFGAAIALFTSCPTCAGYFLGSSLGGLAATSLALALAPYQLALIIVSIPVLFVNPILVSRGVSRVLQKGC